MSNLSDTKKVFIIVGILSIVLIGLLIHEFASSKSLLGEKTTSIKEDIYNKFSTNPKEVEYSPDSEDNGDIGEEQVNTTTTITTTVTDIVPTTTTVTTTKQATVNKNFTYDAEQFYCATTMYERKYFDAYIKKYSDKITHLYIMKYSDYYLSSTDLVETWKMSEDGNVIAAVHDDSTENTPIFTLYILYKKAACFPEDSSNYFSGFNKMYYVLGLEDLGTVKIKNASGFFKNNAKLSYFNAVNFVTPNVTDMSYMFYDCPSLNKVDLESFDTSNVTNMSHMFEGDTSLHTIYISYKWNTSKVKNSTNMFLGTTKIANYYSKNVDVSRAKSTSDDGYLTYIKNPDKNYIDIPNGSYTTDLIPYTYGKFKEYSIALDGYGTEGKYYLTNLESGSYNDYFFDVTLENPLYLTANINLHVELYNSNKKKIGECSENDKMLGYGYSTFQISCNIPYNTLTENKNNVKYYKMTLTS